MSTTVLGQDISLPVVISPTGVQAVHPDGEVAVARAAAARGTAMGLSAFASKPVEEVIAANGKLFFQIYWLGDREAIARRVQRAREAGAVGLILTTDWSFSHGRDWGSPKIPEEMNLRTTVRMLPDGADQARLAVGVGEDPASARPAGAQPGATRRARPAVLRGVRRVDEHPAADVGRRRLAARAVGRSVHAQGRDARRRRETRCGCRVFRRSRCPITAATTWTARLRPSGRCLPIVDAVGDDIEVLLDGGIRRGSDVVKAVALGARAVMIGRAYLWGLAAGGQAGVENVLDILRGGIDSALRGHRQVVDSRPDARRRRGPSRLHPRRWESDRRRS